jgi:hypothetical protein
MAIRYLSNETIDGNITVSGTAVVGNTLYLAEYIQHTGNTNNNIRFQTNRMQLFANFGTAGYIDLHDNGNVYIGASNATALTITSSSATFVGTVQTTGVKTPYIESAATNQSLFLYANGSGHIYFGDSTNGTNLYHYSNSNDGKYTSYGFDGNYYTISTTATSGVKINDPLLVIGSATITNTGANPTITLIENSGGTQNAVIEFDQAGENQLYITTNYVSPSDSNRILLQPGTYPALTASGGANGAINTKVEISGTLQANRNIQTINSNLSTTAAPTNFGVYTSEVRLIDTPNGGLKQCRVITDNYGEWILVGRFAASAMTTIQSIWSSESGLDTSTSQSTTTKFSADFGDSYPTEVRIMGATDFTKWRDTRTVDFIYGVPEGRAWKYFFSGGAENGMTFVGPNHSGNNKYGWNINGSYDGFGRWVNPAQTSVGMSDANITNPSAAYTTATNNAFNWESASDAKITVSATRTFSGQDSFVTAGFGNDDNIQGFFDEYPSETSNMQGGVDFSSAVWVLIKLPTAISSGSGGGSGNQWAGGPTTIHNTNTGSVGIGTSSPAVTGKGLQIQNIGNDTTASLKLTGHNNTGTPGAATSTELKHIGDSLKFAINHNGTDALTIGSSASTIGFTLSNTTELGTYPTGAVKRIRMVQGGEIHFGDTTTTGPLGITEGVWDNFGDQDSLGVYSRNHFSVYSYGGTYSNPKLRIDDAGSYFQGSNFGIGVTNPTSGNLVLPQEESDQFKIAFTGASSSSGISTVDQSGSGLYIGANSRVNNSGVVTYHNSALDSSGIYFDGWNGNDMEFYTALAGSPQKRMVIDGYGRVNVYQQMCVGGTTAPTNEKLLVQSGLGNGSEIWRFGTSGRYTFTGHKFFTSITGTATSDGWYTIGNVGDSSSVIINIMTAAHSSATILASRGYGPSNVARIQVLSSTKNANSGYATIIAVRINAGGLIDMQLTWSSGPNVSVHLAYYGLGCDMPTTLALSVGGTGVYPYNIMDTATFRSSAASARVAGELDAVGQIHAGSNINVYSTSKIYFHATTNSNRYIGASSTNDLDIAADDDLNLRAPFVRVFQSGVEHARFTGTSDSWIANGSNGQLGVNRTDPGYTLDVNGTIRATADVIAYSDERVKENIKTIDKSLEKVNQLRGVEFNKIGEDKKSIGVIAQEIEKVIPEVVYEDQDGMKSVAYGNITGVLIEAIKELKAEVEELKKQIK